MTQSTNTSPVDGLSTSPTLISDPAVDVPLINTTNVVSPEGVVPLGIAQPLLSDPATPVFYIQDGPTPDVMLMQQTSLYAGNFELVMWITVLAVILNFPSLRCSILCLRSHAKSLLSERPTWIGWIKFFSFKVGILIFDSHQKFGLYNLKPWFPRTKQRIGHCGVHTN